MGLFDKNDHIKNSKDLNRELKKQKFLSPSERKLIEKKAKKLIDEPSGLSKEEWRKKVAGSMERNEGDNIDREEAERLKRLGK